MRNLNNDEVMRQFKNGDRHVTLRWKEDAWIEFAGENDLELIELPQLEDVGIIEDSLPPRYLVGKKQIVSEIFPAVPDKLIFLEVKDDVNRLYEEIKSMTVAQAFKYLMYKERRGFELESPEEAILEGLLIGYRECDILYFVMGQYFGGPKQSKKNVQIMSKIEGVTGPILCPSCFAKIK